MIPKLICSFVIIVVAFSFSSCNKSKKISCDWVSQSEYQQSIDSASK